MKKINLIIYLMIISIMSVWGDELLCYKFYARSYYNNNVNEGYLKISSMGTDAVCCDDSVYAAEGTTINIDYKEAHNSGSGSYQTGDAESYNLYLYDNSNSHEEIFGNTKSIKMEKEKEYILKLTFTYASSNYSSCFYRIEKEVHIICDAKGPEIRTEEEIDEEGWYKETVKMKIKAEDITGIKKLKITDKTGGETHTTETAGGETEYEVIGDGIHEIKIEGEDNCGNKTTETKTVKIDGTEPVINIEYKKAETEEEYIEGTWTNKYVKVYVEYSDGESGVKDVKIIEGEGIREDAEDVRKEGKEYKCFNMKLSGSFKVKVTDKAGNTAEKEGSVKIDRKEPEIKIECRKEGTEEEYMKGTWTNRDVKVYVRYKDGESGVEDVKIIEEEGKIEEAEDEKKGEWEYKCIRMKESGSFKVRVTDKAGNKKEETVRVQIDKKEPEIRSKDKEEGQWKTREEVKLEYTFTDENIDTETISIKKDGEEVEKEETEEETKRIITIKGDGIYKIEATVKDKAGNIGRLEKEIKIDSKAIAEEEIKIEAEYEEEVSRYREKLGIGKESYSGDIKKIKITVGASASLSTPQRVKLGGKEKKLEHKREEEYSCEYEIEELIEEEEEKEKQIAYEVSDEAGNKTEGKITVKIKRGVTEAKAEWISAEEKEEGKIEIKMEPEAGTDIKWILIGEKEEIVYSEKAEEERKYTVAVQEEGVYRIKAVTVDSYGNSREKEMKVLYRKEGEAPTVKRGTSKEDGIYSSYIYIEGGKEEEEVETEEGERLKLERKYYYYDKGNNAKEIEGYRVGIEDIKREVEWGGEEEKRKLRIFYTESYKAEGNSGDTKTIERKSKEREYVVEDLKPVIEETEEKENEYAAKKIISGIKAVDPDGDKVIYKISGRRGGRNILEKESIYREDINEEIGIERAEKYTGEIEIIIEAKGIRNDKEGQTLEEKWEEEETGSTEYRIKYKGIDFKGPALEDYTKESWNRKKENGEWINEKSMMFSIKDEGSGISSIKVSIFEGYCEKVIRKENIQAGGVKEYKYNLDITGISGEEIKIKYDMVDRAGNTNTEIIETIKIDNTAPEIEEAGYETEGDGSIEIKTRVAESGSGIKKYSWKEKGETEWKSKVPYYNEEEALIYIASEEIKAKEERIIQLKVEDKAGNESETEEIKCGKYRKMARISSFTVEGINERNYVTDIEEVRPDVQLEDKSSYEGYTVRWILKETKGAEAEYKDFNELKKKLEDGKEYEIEVRIRNEYGSEERKKAEKVFSVDTSGPEAIEVEIIQNPVKGKKAEIKIKGGRDKESETKRKIKLVRKAGGGKETEKMDGSETKLWEAEIETDAETAKVKIGTNLYEEEIKEGKVYVVAAAENAAGIMTETEEGKRLTYTEPEGLIVTADEYTAGEIRGSWRGIKKETAAYRYEIKTTEGQILKSEETEKKDVVIELSEEQKKELKKGEVLYLIVKGYNAAGTETERGESEEIRYITGHSECEWEEVPEFAGIAGIWGKYSIKEEWEEIREKKWAVEIYEKENKDGEIRYEWKGTGEGGEYKWNKLTRVKGEVKEDITELIKAKRIESGSKVKLILSVENKAGYETQIKTLPITIDETEPPVPVVTDQGNIINQKGEEGIKVDWGTSIDDKESGSIYYWRWYFGGEEEKGEWKEAEWEEGADGVRREQKKSAQIVNLREERYDGRILYFQVKAVNGIGQESTGRSDGIILDSTAPKIDEINVYTEERMRQESMVGNTVEESELGEKIYVKIQAEDATSWIANSRVKLYEVGTDGRETEITETELQKTSEGNIYKGELETGMLIAGSRFIVRAEAEDAAGNRTGTASGKAVLITGEMPGINEINIQGDTKRININWTTDSEEKNKWIRKYELIIVTPEKEIVTEYVTGQAYSAKWEELNITVKDSNKKTIGIKVYPCNYEYERGKGKESIYNIDLMEPEFLEKEKRIPFEKELTYWNETITGYVKYKTGNTGAAIQWKIENASDGSEITGWEGTEKTKSVDAGLRIEKKTEDLIEGKARDFWHQKRLILNIRAINGMGISSSIKKINAVEIDMTAAEAAEISREWNWTNKYGSLDGIRIKGTEKESGIIAYKTALIKAEAVEKKGIEEALEEACVVEQKLEGKKQIEKEEENIRIIEEGEGEYYAVLGLRNASGLWAYAKSQIIEIDRSAPGIAEINLTGTTKQKVGEKETWVTNGPKQEYQAEANEEVIWKIYEEKTYEEIEEAETYEKQNTGYLNLDNKKEGNVYKIIFEMTDRAGNKSQEERYIRYNKAPEITVLYDGDPEGQIIVWPGHAKSISELVRIRDKEEITEGDYPLFYIWNPGNGEGEYKWTGGDGIENILGNGGEHKTIYYQKGKQQETEYIGILTVTDCYEKSRTIEIKVKVENTREGELKTDEFWTGEHEIKGMITVPEGITLKTEDVEIKVNGKSERNITDGGIEIKGRLESKGKVLIESGITRNKWKGIKVKGVIEGEEITIRGAQRGITLIKEGKIKLEELDIRNCMTGLHLLGGILDVGMLRIIDNSQYGIKQDAAGQYSYEIENSSKEVYDNGKDYYKEGIVNQEAR